MPAPSELRTEIWEVCNLLRGPCKRNEYCKVILPLTVLRRFGCVLAPTRANVLAAHEDLKSRPPKVIQGALVKITGHRFYKLSPMQLALNVPHSLLDDPNNLAANGTSHIQTFSENVRTIMEKFKFHILVVLKVE